MRPDNDAVAENSSCFTAHQNVAIVASVVAHAVILVALVFLFPKIEEPQHQWVLAYLMDMGPSGGGAGRGVGAGYAGGDSPPAFVHEAATAAMPPKLPHAHRRAARAARPQTAASAATPVVGDDALAARSAGAVAPTAPTAPAHAANVVASATTFGSGLTGAGGGSGSGSGGGNGTGVGNGNGSGSSSFAHVEYGRNPAPEYPGEARRRAQHGTVLLRIEVAADGSVERVEIMQSSGFDLLDDSALETVRARWRFVPARRDGIAMESWCEVPIRFALTEAQAE